MKSTIGERIRVLRLIRSLSQENMANELDISVASYSNIERDVTDLTVTRLLKIAKILSVNPIDILAQHSTSVILEAEQKGYTPHSQLENAIEELKGQVLKLANEITLLKSSKQTTPTKAAVKRKKSS